MKASSLGLLAVAAVLFLGTACATIATPKGWSGPLAVDGAVLISSKNNITAVSPDTFVRLWTFPDDKRFPEDEDIKLDGIYGTPVTAAGVVYFGAYNGDVYALDLEAGRPLWAQAFQTDGPVIGGVALGQDILYAASDDGILYAIDPESGVERDRFDAGESIWATPLATEGAVYVATMDGELYALDPATLDPLWSGPFQAGAGLVSTPLLAGDTILIGGMDRELHAINAASGREVWSFKADNWFWTQPLVADGVVYAGSLDGNVYALALSSGDPIWPEPFAAAKAVRAAPILVGGTLVVADGKGNIYGLDPATGALRWGSLETPISLGGDVLGHPALLGTEVLFTTQGGTLFRINPQDGSLQRVTLQT